MTTVKILFLVLYQCWLDDGECVKEKQLHSQMFHFEGPGSDWTSGNCRAGPLILFNTHKDREQVSEFFLLLANQGRWCCPACMSVIV